MKRASTRTTSTTPTANSKCRYAAGEGAAFAKSIGLGTSWITAVNRREFDRRLRELSSPDARFETRSRSPFPGRSFADVSASLQELSAMVTSIRAWNSAVHWLSPACVICRMEREALGPEGEHYEWTRLYVAEISSGLLASLCEFELEDEEAAFAYAEERMRESTARLAVNNRSRDVVHAVVSGVTCPRRRCHNGALLKPVSVWRPSATHRLTLYAASRAATRVRADP